MGRSGYAMVVALLLAAAGCSDGRVTGNAQTSLAQAFGGPFTMIDQNRKIVSDRTLAGAPFVIFFGFTRCPEVCPTTMSRLAQLRKKLGADADRFKVVFVSVDSEHDKPEDLKSFLSMFDLPALGLTGNPTQTAAIVKDYGVYYERVPLPGGDYTIDHSAGVYLMDRHGAFVSTLDVHEPDNVALSKLRQMIAA